MSNSDVTNTDGWTDICANDDLIADTGLCALHEGEQVAIFKVAQSNEIFALQNYDPLGEANVLSRGLIGSVGDEKVIISPLYKQRFNLKSGLCLEDQNVQLKIYPVRIVENRIQLKKAL